MPPDPGVVSRTRTFYEWDQRGRGWELHPYPVSLEPTLRAPTLAPVAAQRLDDTRKDTWLSSFLSGNQDSLDEEVEEGPAPAPVVVSAPAYESITLTVPEELEISPRAAEAWLRSLETARHPVAWELVGSSGSVHAQVSGATLDLSLLDESLGAVFPDVVRLPADQTLDALWIEGRSDYVLGIELGLGHEFVVPLADLRDFKLDPLAQIVTSLASVASESAAVLQVLFKHIDSRWPEVIRQAVTTPHGEPFFADAPEITHLAEEKVSSPLLAAAVRLAVSAPTAASAWDVVRGVAGGLAQLKSPGNELIPVSMERSDRVVGDVLRRTTHRHGMILSTRELVGLVHLPSASVRSEALARVSQETARAPANTQGKGVLLGINEYHGREVEVRLDDEARLRHTHVVGASGTGKSTLLVSMILDDVAQGHGVGVVDPHGDLVDELLARIPESRRDDIVLIDPADPDYVVGWNILAAHTDLEKELLASDLTATFQRLATSWGDQMSTVLSNAVLAFLSSSRGGTILELRKFLIDDKFRGQYLKSVTDEYIASYWREDFPLIAGRRPQGPILTRLNTFLRNRLVRDVVTATKAQIDLRQVMDRREILLARLSQGAIGEENAALLGSLLVSKFHQVTLSRQELAKEARTPFFLYIDEFHELATPSMATMFSGLRKYGLALTVAHQDLYQLRQSLPGVERAVLANSHTRICFRVGDDDAKRLADGFASFGADGLTNLDIGEAIVRVGKRTDDFNLRTFDIPRLDEQEAKEVRQATRAYAMAHRGAHRQGAKEIPRVEVQEPTVEVPHAAKQARGSRPERASRDLKLDKATLDYLEHVAQHPFLTVRERNEALSLSASRGQRTKAAILDERLAKEVAINPGGRGSQFKLLELTTAGRHTLRDFDIPLPLGHGRGGIAHQWWVRTIADWLGERGISSRIEDDSEGVRVDLAFRVGNRLVAVEVETSSGHEIENIRKDLGAGFDFVVSLGESPLSAEALEQGIPNAPPGVVLGSLQEFKECLVPSSTSLARPNQNQEPGRSRRRRQSSPSGGGPPPAPYYVPEPGVLTTPAAAEYLGLSPATLDTMRSRGGGPVFSKLGRRIVYRREDLDSWVLERQQRSTSDS